MSYSEITGTPQSELSGLGLPPSVPIRTDMAALDAIRKYHKQQRRQPPPARVPAPELPAVLLQSPEWDVMQERFDALKEQWAANRMLDCDGSFTGIVAVVRNHARFVFATPGADAPPPGPED
jgi:hypothetical protein